MLVFHDKLKELRKAHKLTINQVADYLGKFRHTISNWEKSKTVPSKTDVIAMAQLYGVKVSDISEYNDLPVLTSGAIIKDKNIDDEIASLENNINNISDTNTLALKKLHNEFKLLLRDKRNKNKEIRRLRASLNSINEILYIKDKNRIIRKTNDKFANILPGSYTKDDALGSKSIDFFGLKEIKDIVPYENEVFEKKIRVIDKEIKIPGTGGARRGLLSIEPIFDDYDNVIEIAVSIKDITEIVENVERMRLLEEIINKLNNRVWIVVPHTGEYLFSSKGTKYIYGFTPEGDEKYPDFLLSDVTKKDFIKLGLYPFKNNIIDPGNYKFRIRHKDGSIKWINQSIYHAQYKGKTILYGIDFDITEDVNRYRKLKELDNAINYSNEAVWTAACASAEKQNFVYEYISDNFYRITGIKYENFFKGGNNNWTSFQKKILDGYIFPEDRVKAKKFFSLAKYPKEIDLRFQVEGRIKWLNIKINLIEDTFYGYARDISLRKRQEEELKAALATFDAADEVIWLYRYDDAEESGKIEFIHVNKFAETLYEMPLGNLSKSMDISREKVHKDDRKKVNEIYDSPEKSKGSLSYRLVMDDGRVKYINAHWFIKKINNIKYAGIIEKQSG
ncbi:PAS domain S-box protein [Lentisphaerota bacterium ZTH]|nr:PAS domain S-box protein [Lentisphaerota bacterium]WET05913.1 PAS domain S-box protein [Lentisphaerota bacterium ZTH]